MIGVDPQTIYRWERGERKPSAHDYKRAIEVYDEARRRSTELGQMVSRETSRVSEEAPPRTADEAERRIRSLLMRLEGDLIDAGATLDDRRDWHDALKTDYHVRMFGGGNVESPDDDALRRFKNFVSAARALTQTTIDRLTHIQEDGEK